MHRHALTRGQLRDRATGPKAKELLRSKIVIPAGTGIAGFCCLEDVSVAVSDVQRDPRFYAAIGEKIDFETRSILCAPMMTHGRSFGCPQLINRKGGPQFAEHEVGVLAYLAHQAALRGVTSMSAGTHKFGYAAKGTSVVLYRGRALRSAQYFTTPEWSGGLYVSSPCSTSERITSASFHARSRPRFASARRRRPSQSRKTRRHEVNASL
ncbi:MAG: GAF domain-containing protein [Myxococcaceae bacterium]|nr:GAF domain-containing protein [Myxococcaceae bacterium]